MENKTYSIKQFVDDYQNIATESLKDDFINDNLKITEYTPFAIKHFLCDKLVKSTMLDKQTGNVRMNTPAFTLMFCKMVIESATNLKADNPGFYEEYDALRTSGLFDKLFKGTNSKCSIIPVSEINEFSSICEMLKNDLIANKYETKAFILDIITNLSSNIKVLEPAIINLSNSLENLDDDKIKKLENIISKFLK